MKKPGISLASTLLCAISVRTDVISNCYRPAFSLLSLCEKITPMSH
jgi:hypothetical protein